MTQVIIAVLQARPNSPYTLILLTTYALIYEILLAAQKWSQNMQRWAKGVDMPAYGQPWCMP